MRLTVEIGATRRCSSEDRGIGGALRGRRIQVGAGSEEVVQWRSCLSQVLRAEDDEDWCLSMAGEEKDIHRQSQRLSSVTLVSSNKFDGSCIGRDLSRCGCKQGDLGQAGGLGANSRM